MSENVEELRDALTWIFNRALDETGQDVRRLQLCINDIGRVALIALDDLGPDALDQAVAAVEAKR